MARFWFALACGCLVIACNRPDSKPEAFPAGKTGQTSRTTPTSSATNTAPSVTPGGALPGRVVLVNPGGRFAVLNFPLGAMPPTSTRIGVYRDGLKVAELRVTGPQRDHNTVADLLRGEVRSGDEARVE